MDQEDFIKKLGIPSIEHPDKKYNELKEQFLEMSQIKSDFDIEKFTVKKEGHFIAHNFHFLMRQYSLALSELRRMNIDRKEKLRNIEKLELFIDKNKTVFHDKIVYEFYKIEINGKKKYADLEIERLINELDMLDLNITNKAIMCDRFDKARKKIIEMNNGKPPTNKQYQEEEPEYWSWQLKRKAIWQHQERGTGISEGVWENIEHLEQPALINPKFQIQVKDADGLLQLDEINKEVNVKRQLKHINTKT